MTDDSTRHFGPAELAAREDVPIDTVYAWNRLRTGPRFMKIGRHVRYRLADIRRGKRRGPSKPSLASGAGSGPPPRPSWPTSALACSAFARGRRTA